MQQAGFIVNFFKSQIELKEGIYCCEIQDSYMYENHPDFQELFCNAEKSPQKALRDTVLEIFEWKWVEGMSDIHFFEEFPKNMMLFKSNAQKIEWAYR